MRITPTESGYRWSNRKGDWITYDEQGHITSYGDKNNVAVRFGRNANGLINQIRDNFGRLVVTFIYNGLLPIRIVDYTGRTVQYQWNPFSNPPTLTNVITVRGDEWRYEYEEFGYNRVLTKKTDSIGQMTEYQNAPATPSTTKPPITTTVNKV